MIRANNTKHIFTFHFWLGNNNERISLFICIIYDIIHSKGDSDATVVSHVHMIMCGYLKCVIHAIYSCDVNSYSIDYIESLKSNDLQWICYFLNESRTVLLRAVVSLYTFPSKSTYRLCMLASTRLICS